MDPFAHHFRRSALFTVRHTQAKHSRSPDQGIRVVQVALLQGLTDAAADQAAAASLSGLPSGDTSKAQQWIKQQVNSLAARTSLLPNLPESELMFLPDVMTRAAHQAGPTTDATAADGGDGRAGAGVSGSGGGAGVSGGGGGDGGSGDGGGGGGNPSHGGLVQADQQRESSVCAATYAARGDQHLGRGQTSAPVEPVSWLEWEQQLQVTVSVLYPWHMQDVNLPACYVACIDW